MNKKNNNKHKRATPKWVTKSCDNRYDEVCGWKSLWDITSSLVFYPFFEKFELDFWPWPKVKVIDTWVIECNLLGCTLVPSMKCIGEIGEIWPFFVFLPIFGKIWPWPKVKVIGTWVIECALLGCTLVPSMKSVGEIAAKIWPV